MRSPPGRPEPIIAAFRLFQLINLKEHRFDARNDNQLTDLVAAAESNNVAAVIVQLDDNAPCVALINQACARDSVLCIQP